MTNIDIIAMARLAGAWSQQSKNCDVEYVMSGESLERFTAISEALAEQPAQQEPDAIVTSLTAGPDGVARSGLDRELPLMTGVYLAPQPAQQSCPCPECERLWHKAWPDSGAFVRASAQDLERFAALVAAAERRACERHFEVAMRYAILAEREACAKAAQDFLTSGRSPLGRSVADAIRERLLNARARAVGDRAYDRYEGETK